ncbi:MAG: glycosyltransferase family 4 protein [Candidatus Sifarchaeia archaeon]
MNLLVLGPYGDATSGPSRVLTEVVTHLSSDIDVFVLSPKKRREHTRVDFDRNNIHVRYQPLGNIPRITGSHQWIEFVRINRRLAKLDYQPDLVWIHDAALFAAYRFSRFRTVPSVSTIHGVFGSFYRSEADQRLNRFIVDFFAKQNMSLQKYQFTNSPIITTYSEYLRGLIKSVSPSTRIEVIPNGVNIERFPVSKAPRKEIIVYVGRMAKIKGVHILLESMKDVIQYHPDWSLWLVGGAFDQPISFFQKFITPKTESRIKFLGPIPNEELAGILNEAGIFVMPTIRDGFEIALMEAMATGIPCVTTSAFERIELYDGFAEMVPPNDPTALGRKLSFIIENFQKFISDDESKKRITRALQFNWNRIAEKYEILFHKLS